MCSFQLACLLFAICVTTDFILQLIMFLPAFILASCSPLVSTNIVVQSPSSIQLDNQSTTPKSELALARQWGTPSSPEVATTLRKQSMVRSGCDSRFLQLYTGIISSMWARIIVGFAMLGYATLAVYGIVNWQTDLDLKKYTSIGSPTYQVREAWL